MVAPVLLSEIASNKTRGAITSLHQLNVRGCRSSQVVAPRPWP